LSIKNDKPNCRFYREIKKIRLPYHALQAVAIIKREIPDAKMWIIGDGYFRKKLESFERKDVTFNGHISNEKNMSY
jgi:glycosyltransferase involved in cell wall biosynthesis